MVAQIDEARPRVTGRPPGCACRWKNDASAAVDDAEAHNPGAWRWVGVGGDVDERCAPSGGVVAGIVGILDRAEDGHLRIDKHGDTCRQSNRGNNESVVSAVGREFNRLANGAGIQRRLNAESVGLGFHRAGKNLLRLDDPTDRRITWLGHHARVAGNVGGIDIETRCNGDVTVERERSGVGVAAQRASPTVEEILRSWPGGEGKLRAAIVRARAGNDASQSGNAGGKSADLVKGGSFGGVLG